MANRYESTEDNFNCRQSQHHHRRYSNLNEPDDHEDEDITDEEELLLPPSNGRHNNQRNNTRLWSEQETAHAETSPDSLAEVKYEEELSHKL